MTVASAPFPAPFTPFEVRWDAPQLTDAEIATTPTAFEWWYFDVSTTTGVELVVIMSRVNAWFASGKCTMNVQYKDGRHDVHKLRNYSRSDFRWTQHDGRGEMCVGPNTLQVIGATPESMHYEMTLKLSWISGTLTFTPRHLGFLPTPDGTYFRSRTNPSSRTCVSFSAPVMQCTGTLVIGGETIQVDGHGYHDHPWGTANLFQTNAEWHWARAFSGGNEVMFATVSPFPEFEGALRFLWAAAGGVFEPTISSDVQVDAEDWKRNGSRSISYPHNVAVASGTRRWVACCRQSLLDFPFYNRSSVSWQEDGMPGAGSGWLEYWKLSARKQRLTFIAAKVSAFFQREFPYFGK